MDKKIIRAKIDLMLTSPFWGSLVTRLELKDWDGDTFATNGKYLYCPDIKHIKDWTFQQITGVLAHETWHCAGGHIFRMRDKPLMKWNVAADFATNYLLKKNRFTLPEGALEGPQYDGMTAEKIYALLPDGDGGGEGGEGGKGGQGKGQLPKCPQDLKDPGKGSGKDGGKDGKGGQDGQGQAPDSGMDPKELEQEWKEAITSAARQAKGRGNMPGGMEEYIDEILSPKVPWQEVLYRYLQTAKGNTDYTTYPFNRRHIWREMYLPSLQGEMIEMICGIDTSGSISHEDLTRYFSELRGICTIFGSYVIHLFQCDTKIHSYDIITEDSELPSLAQGRGGTAFEPVFNKILEEQIEELPVVYFTDLDGSFPKDYLGDGVFWLVRKGQARYGRDDVPFGAIIEIDD